MYHVKRKSKEDEERIWIDMRLKKKKQNKSCKEKIQRRRKWLIDNIRIWLCEHKFKGKGTNIPSNYHKWYVNTLRYTLRLYIPSPLLFWVVYTLKTNGRTHGFIVAIYSIFFIYLHKIKDSPDPQPNTLHLFCERISLIPC